MQGGRASFTSLHINHSLPGPKRKRGPGSQRHWDDPEQQSSMLPYDEDDVEKIKEDAENDNVEEEEEEEESRELTHDEMWDDSALIDAWESATAEYEVTMRVFLDCVFLLTGVRYHKAYHGKGKSWKKEPTKRSPLSVSSHFMESQLT